MAWFLLSAGGVRTMRQPGWIALAGVFVVGCAQLGSGGSSNPGVDGGDDSTGDGGGGDGGVGGGDGGNPAVMDVAFDYVGLVDAGHGDGGSFYPVDIDGDGKTELVMIASNGDGSRRLYPHLARGGSLQFTGSSWSSPLKDTSAEHKWLLADVDGDKKTDFVETTRNGDGTKQVYVSLSTGTSWAYVGTSYHHDSADGPIDYVAMDVNGDGRKDWVQIGANGDGSRLLSWALSVPGGSRLTGGNSFKTPAVNGGASYRYADFDGDGFDDFLELVTLGDGKGWDLYLSRGTSGGFQYGGSPFHAAVSAQVDGMRIFDADGDGDADVVALCHDGQGRRVLQPIYSRGSSFVVGPASLSAAAAAGVAATQTEQADLNGDGVVDYLEVDGSSGATARTLFGSLGTSNGFIAAPTHVQTPFSDALTDLFALDLDGDGKSEPVLYKYWYDTDHHHAFHVFRSP